jgi:hypothetical protein
VAGAGQRQDRSRAEQGRADRAPGQVDDIARLNEIVEAYKRRFKQQSVVMVVRPACVSF